MRRAVLLIMIFTLTVTACDETKKVIDVAGNVQLTGTYDVTSMNENTIDAKSGIYIGFSGLDNTIRGNTGCNSFFGSYNLDLYALSFSDIGSTEMACEPGVMLKEGALLEALTNTGSYTIKEGVLTLYSKIDRTELLTAKKRITKEEE